MDLTMSVSGTFSIRMRTVPEVSLAISPLPVDCVWAGPPLPAQAAASSVTVARRATIIGRRRLLFIDLIAALFLSSCEPKFSVRAFGDHRRALLAIACDIGAMTSPNSRHRR